MHFSMIVTGLIISAAAVAVWFLAYFAAGWFLETRHLVELNDPKTVASLLPLIPPAMATAASIATAASGAVVALINRKAQLDLARIQNEYLQDLERKRLEYNKELEEKKKTLSAELEREKVQLDVFKSDVNRRLTLIGRASEALSKYSASIRMLGRGVFDPDSIEEKEQEIRALAVEWKRESGLFKVWHEFMRSGI
jgi:hypothetical protein